MTNNYKTIIYRFDPVPGTGRKRWKFYAFYKRQKTTQELRTNHSDMYDKYTRGKRRNIPTAWDDVVRSDYRCRKSWKRYRRYQCKKITLNNDNIKYYRDHYNI